MIELDPCPRVVPGIPAGRVAVITPSLSHQAEDLITLFGVTVNNSCLPPVRPGLLWNRRANTFPVEPTTGCVFCNCLFKNLPFDFSPTDKPYIGRTVGRINSALKRFCFPKRKPLTIEPFHRVREIRVTSNYLLIYLSMVPGAAHIWGLL